MTTKRGEAAAIVPSEMKGRKHPMTDDEFLWLLERERRELATAGRPTIDRGWKTRQVTGAMVSVAAQNRSGTTKGGKMNGDTLHTPSGDSAAPQGTGPDAATGQMAQTVTIDRDRWLRVHAAAWWAYVHAQHPYLIALLREDLDIYELPSIEQALAESGPLDPNRYVLVDREQWERVRTAAEQWVGWWYEFGTPMHVAIGKAGLIPGDLEPSEPEAGR